MRRHLTTIIAAVAALSLTAIPAGAAPVPDAVAPSSGVIANANPGATPAVTPKQLMLRYGTFKTKKYSGKGTKLIKLPKRAEYGLVTINARGKGHLKVQAIAKNKKKTMGRPLVGKRTQPYKGTTLLGVDSNQTGATYLKVESSSKKKWTITVKPIHRAPKLKKNQKGSLDGVFRYTQPKTKRWNVRYASSVKDNLIVTTYGLTGNQSLINKIVKKYTGKVKVMPFTGLVEVRSNGDWTIKR